MKILFLLFAGLLVSGCIGETLFTIKFLQYKQSDVIICYINYINYKLKQRRKRMSNDMLDFMREFDIDIGLWVHAPVSKKDFDKEEQNEQQC